MRSACRRRRTAPVATTPRPISPLSTVAGSGTAWGTTGHVQTGGTVCGTFGGDAGGTNGGGGTTGTTTGGSGRTGSIRIGGVVVGTTRMGATGGGDTIVTGSGVAYGIGGKNAPA